MSPRNSRVTSTEVTFGFWLAFEEAGGVRLTRTEPHLDRAERAMYLQTTLPRSLWRRPTLRAEIKVQPGQDTSKTINLTVASEVLRSALGVDIDLKVNQP